MRTIFLSTLIFLSTTVFSQTISKFESKADVLVYLNNKSFTSNNGVTLSFFDMGGRFKSNKGLSYFNPDVILLSKTKALLQYKSLTSSGFAKFTVDCNINVLTDRTDNATYTLGSPSSESKYKEPLTKSEIIGSPIKLGYLLVAQNDIDFQMRWDHAIDVCLELGSYWRLPNKEELNVLHQNKNKIGRFSEGNYWSSTSRMVSDNKYAWLQGFNAFGRQDEVGIDARANIRCVKDWKQEESDKEAAILLNKNRLIYEPLNVARIIGEPFKIGKMMVARNDFKQLDLKYAEDSCAKLGKGWRLPNKEELKVLYENRTLIGGFSPNFYISSTDDQVRIKISENEHQTIKSRFFLNFLNGEDIFTFIRNLKSSSIEMALFLRAVKDKDLTANELIIGEPKKIRTLIIAQYDFPNQMNWNEAKEACANLGDGWRLPNKLELDLLFQNKDKIGGFGLSGYWSSSEDSSALAWIKYFSSGNQSSTTKNFTAYVRAIRSL